ncbi:MAG: hypothetical protein KAS73_15450 [Candidatus Sabulitectum sp.]|nr:hypothetical protein [Candidatus Sabulitectum sp.]
MKVFFSVLFLFFFAACTNPFDTSIEIRYEVIGSAESVSITYENGGGGVSQVTNVGLPWSHTLSVDPGDYVYLHAHNLGESGSITVTIYQNGDVFKRASSAGAYVIVSVSGTL